MSKFALINDPRKLVGLITRVHTAGTKFDALLHEAAFNCVMHSVNTHDVRPLQRLYHGLPANGQRALRVWAAKFGAVRYSQKSDAFSWDKRATADVDSMEAVSPMQYVRAVAPRVAHAFDLKAEIAKLIKRADKHNVNGKAVALLTSAAAAA